MNQFSAKANQIRVKLSGVTESNFVGKKTIKLLLSVGRRFIIKSSFFKL